MDIGAILNALTTFLGPFIPVVVQLIGIWLKNKAANSDTQAAFLAFAEAMSRDPATQSARLKSSFDAQKARVQALIDQQDQGVKDGIVPPVSPTANQSPPPKS